MGHEKDKATARRGARGARERRDLPLNDFRAQLYVQPETRKLADYCLPGRRIDGLVDGLYMRLVPSRRLRSFPRHVQRKARAAKLTADQLKEHPSLIWLIARRTSPTEHRDLIAEWACLWAVRATRKPRFRLVAAVLTCAFRAAGRREHFTGTGLKQLWHRRRPSAGRIERLSEGDLDRIWRGL